MKSPHNGTFPSFLFANKLIIIFGYRTVNFFNGFYQDRTRRGR